MVVEFQQFYVFPGCSPAQVVVLSVIILRLRVKTQVFVEDQVIYLQTGELDTPHPAQCVPESLHLYASAARHLAL